MSSNVVPLSRQMFIQRINGRMSNIETLAMENLEYLQHQSLEADQYRHDAGEILVDATKHLTELKHRLESRDLDAEADGMQNEIALFADDFNGWIDHGIGW